MFGAYKSKLILFAVTIILIFSFAISCGICAAKYQFNLPCADVQWGEGGIYSTLFAESVRIATGGDIDIKVFPGGEWGGSEEDYLKEIQLGSLDMACLATSPIGQFTDALVIFDIAFLFKGPIEETLFTFKSETEFTPVVEKLIERVNKEADMILLTVAPIGRRDIFSNKPLNKIEDLNGLKIRCMGSQVQVDAFNFMGALATPLPYSECYTALQLKTVDAMENSPNVYISKRFNEVAPYWMGTNHYTCVQAIVMSKKAWNSLPSAYQNIVKNCAIGAGYIEAQWAIGAAGVYLGGPVAQVAKTMVYPTEAELKELRRKTLPKLLDKYSKQIGMDNIEILSKEDEVIKDWYEGNN